MSRPAQPRIYVHENPMLACAMLAPASSKWRTFADPEYTAGDELVIRGPHLGPLLRVPHGDQPPCVPTAGPVIDVYYSLLSRAELEAEGRWIARASYYALCKDHSWKEGGSRNREIDQVIQFLDRAQFTMSPPQVGTGPFTHGPVFRSIQDASDGLVVQVAPDVLSSESLGAAARIDVELLARLSTPMEKAGYRLVAGLKALNVTQIALDEFLDRSGSLMKKRRPSEVQARLGGLWETLVSYGYVCSVPEPQKDRKGQYQLFFDWATPAELPAGEDELFHKLLDEQVSMNEAARMLQENARRAKLVLEACLAGALGEPRSTRARQIVGAFNKSDWDMEAAIARHKAVPTRVDIPAEMHPPQEQGSAPTDLDFSDSGWAELSRRGGAPDDLREVSIAVLRRAGEKDPIGQLQKHEDGNLIYKAYDRLGWEGTVAVLLSVYKFGKVDYPTSYLAKSLRNKMGLGMPSGPSQRHGGKPVTPRVVIQENEVIQDGQNPLTVPAEPPTSEKGGEASPSQPEPAKQTLGSSLAGGDDQRSESRLGPSSVEGTVAEWERWKNNLVRSNAAMARAVLSLLDYRTDHCSHPKVEQLRAEVRERAEHILDQCSEHDTAA